MDVIGRMDALFAAHLGETALVQVHECEGKGKGVFALVNLAPGDTALTDEPMAFLQSADLTAATVVKKSDVNPKVHDTCDTCGAFTGTIQTQLKTLLEARSVTCSKPASAGSQKRKPLPPPPLNTLTKLPLPESKEQPTKLRPAAKRKGTDGGDTCTHPTLI